MVSVKNITYKYSRHLDYVLNNVSFDIDDGQCIGILGNNGTGKSTLLKCIDRICSVTNISHTHKASVLINNEDVFKMSNSKMARHIAYVPQTMETVDMTVFDAILLGRKPYITWDASSKDLCIVNEIINEMGLEDFILRNVSELSGGEVQRVMLARAIAQKPHLLLLDEPTSNLDPYNQHEVLRIVRKIAKSHNICVAIVIHDLNLAVRYCDSFLFLKDSKVYSHGGIETITPKAIKEVYGIQSDIIQHGDYKVIIPV